MKIFGQKREKLTGNWRKVHDEELHNLYTSPYTVWMTIIQEEKGEACCMHERNEKHV